MRISELSEATGVSIATLKYYLREGLVPPGRQTAPNQADYGDEHVHRVRLVRVLREVGDLPVEAIREVVTAIEDPERSRHAVVGTAHRALDREVDDGPSAEREEVDAWLDEELRWHVGPDAPGRDQLALALASLRRLGREVGPEAFARYARVAAELATEEVASVTDAGSAAAAVEAAVVGTVVYESVLVALRRLAQEHVSATN